MFCPLIRKLHAFEIPKWAQGRSQWRKQDIQFQLRNTTYIFTAVKYNFLYFTAVKYSFFKNYALYLINIFSVFHYFVYNKKHTVEKLGYGYIKTNARLLQGSHKLWKSWKIWKITQKSSMHGKIMECVKPE